MGVRCYTTKEAGPWRRLSPGHTISDFVLENAYQMATELLADEGTIVLSKKQVAHIFEVLDHPPAKSVSAVRKLLTERSILDG